MTLDEAKQELADPTGNSPHKVVEAARVLLDALRAAEAQVAQMQSGGAEALREAAAKVIEDAEFVWGTDWHETFDPDASRVKLAAEIRALPVPPARTSEPAAPTPGPTVCADCGAPAVHLDVKNRRHSTPCCGSERCCFRACLGYDTRPLDAPAEKPAFDAEAALEAMRWVFDTAHDQLEVNVADVRGAIDAGLAAGRRGAR